MAIVKKYAKNKPNICKVCFVVDGEDAAKAKNVSVAGDFNGWDVHAAPMTKKKDTYVYSVDLPAGREYRFRYVLDGHTWQNDPKADHYQVSDLGDCLDSVIAV